MQHYDLKIYLLNGFALIVTYADFNKYLTIVVPLIAMGYTLHRWGIMIYDRHFKKPKE